MKTRRLRITRNLPEWTAIDAAVRVIRQGGIIAFPTDTTYGLAAGIYCERAIRRLRRIKGRGPEEPFVLIAADTDWVRELAARVSQTHRRLMNAYWPGPLTLVFEASKAVPDYLVGRDGSVAIRIPDDALTQTILRASGVPLAAPSANLRARKPAVSAAEVLASFKDTIDLVLDGGTVEGTMPSTIVAVGRGGLEILRKGRLEIAEDCA